MSSFLIWAVVIGSCIFIPPLGLVMVAVLVLGVIRSL